MAAHLPKSPHGYGQTQAKLNLRMLLRPTQRGAYVVMLALDASEPDDLLRPCQLRLGILRQIKKEKSVATINLLNFSTRCKLFKAKLFDSLKHAKATFILRLSFLP